MPLAESLDVIDSEGRRILELARRDPARPVPQYPEWTMADLLSHVGSILARTTQVCLLHPAERISAPRLPEGKDVGDWYEAILAEMIGTLDRSDLDVPVWGFVEGSTIQFWVRRMVVETGVHRWDAEQAFGEETPLREPVAEHGLDEFAEVWFPRLGEIPVLEVIAEDLGKTWIYGSGAPAARVEGSGSDIYLRLMSRPSPVRLPDDWETAIGTLAPPPKP
jgi:uncharacterized protein (TIGR03083 family)